MPMVDLTVSKEERKEEQEKMIDSPLESDVPWGLHIHLSDKEIEKLGLKNVKLKAGSEMMAKVKLRVSEVSEMDDERGTRKSARFAIIAMSFDDGDRLTQTANTMFDNDGQ